MTPMHRETLREHLHNPALVTILTSRREIQQIKDRLHAAIQTMREAGVTEHAIAEAEKKYDEYKKIGKEFDELIDNVWSLPWQHVSIIVKYLNYDESEIDRLPDHPARC